MSGFLLLLALGACCVPDLTGTEEAAGASTTPSRLRSASSFEGGCYTRFDPEHHAEVETRLSKGKPAVDFTLKDRKGHKVHLADLLEERPVVVMTGSYTCDRYQGRMRAINKFAREFEDDVHTVVVYTLEAHPKGDPSPYRGKPWERKFSDRHQATSYNQRLLSAGDMGITKPVIGLVDQMDNPFWCTYGTCPNCAFLIAQDGTVEAVHDWFDPKTMTSSTRSLLARSDR